VGTGLKSHPRAHLYTRPPSRNGGLLLGGKGRRWRGSGPTYKEREGREPTSKEDEREGMEDRRNETGGEGRSR